MNTPIPMEEIFEEFKGFFESPHLFKSVLRSIASYGFAEMNNSCFVTWITEAGFMLAVANYRKSKHKYTPVIFSTTSPIAVKEQLTQLNSKVFGIDSLKAGKIELSTYKAA